jgi:nicotinic acid mononucleotide adenylyltransferase
LFVAEAVRDDIGLDKVVFVPTRNGAHRSNRSRRRHQRATMVRLAIAANPAFAFDESDLAPGGDRLYCRPLACLARPLSER